MSAAEWKVDEFPDPGHRSYRTVQVVHGVEDLHHGGDHPDKWLTVDVDGRPIGDRRKLAAEVARAMNSHAALLEALRKATAERFSTTEGWDSWCVERDAALKDAGVVL